MLEQTIMKKIMLAVSAAGARVFRQNVGVAWVGEPAPGTPGSMVRINPGDVVLRNARPLHAGLCKGSSDLIGFTPVEIKPEHVGATIAVFTALELKAAKGRVSEAQADFIAAVKRSGGIAGVARSEAEALKLLGVGV
jgi:hypothetical protein